MLPLDGVCYDRLARPARSARFAPRVGEQSHGSFALRPPSHPLATPMSTLPLVDNFPLFLMEMMKEVKEGAEMKEGVEGGELECCLRGMCLWRRCFQWEGAEVKEGLEVKEVKERA